MLQSTDVSLAPLQDISLIDHLAKVTMHNQVKFINQQTCWLDYEVVKLS